MGGGRRSAPPPPPATAAATSAPRQMEQDEPTVVEAEGEGVRRKRRGKRALISQPAAANVGGEGSSGLQIPKG